MNRVVHFEIQAEKPERAAKFYRESFGWTIEKWSYGLEKVASVIFHGGGALFLMIGIVKALAGKFRK